MLNDRDRASLHEIQQQLFAEDAQFVQTFDAEPPDLPDASLRPVDEFQRPYTVLMWLLTAIGLLQLLAGSIGGAVLFAGLAVALWLIRHRDDASTART